MKGGVCVQVCEGGGGISEVWYVVLAATLPQPVYIHLICLAANHHPCPHWHHRTFLRTNLCRLQRWPSLITLSTAAARSPVGASHYWRVGQKKGAQRVLLGLVAFLSRLTHHLLSRSSQPNSPPAVPQANRHPPSSAQSWGNLSARTLPAGPANYCVPYLAAPPPPPPPLPRLPTPGPQRRDLLSRRSRGQPWQSRPVGMGGELDMRAGMGVIRHAATGLHRWSNASDV